MNDDTMNAAVTMGAAYQLAVIAADESIRRRPGWPSHLSSPGGIYFDLAATTPSLHERSLSDLLGALHVTCQAILFFDFATVGGGKERSAALQALLTSTKTKATQSAVAALLARLPSKQIVEAACSSWKPNWHSELASVVEALQIHFGAGTQVAPIFTLLFVCAGSFDPCSVWLSEGQRIEAAGERAGLPPHSCAR